MSLLDKFMDTYGSGDWNFNALSEPKTNIVAVDEEGAVSLADFIEGVLRVPGSTKRARMLFDVHRSCPEVGQWRSVCNAIKNNSFDTLPPELRPAAAVPADVKLGMVARNNEDGTMDLVKVYYFEGKDPANVKQL